MFWKMGWSVALVTCVATTIAGAEEKPGVVMKPFGKTMEGVQVEQFTFTNKNGIQARVMTLGATLTSVVAPDKAGNFEEITLGYDNVEGYLAGHPYFGSTVGRVANRIANGKFTLNGKTYKLATNNGANHLHGGEKAFDKVVWKAEITGPQSVKFTYHSKDGEEGYPGNLVASITYTLTDENALNMDYSATTDQATPINLTNHAYFNLGGPKNKTILNHTARILADRYTPSSAALVPTGELKSVEGTPFDFTKETTIGDRLSQTGGDPIGYDLNYVLNAGEGVRLAAVVADPASGRTLEVHTTEPGIQFYTGNFLSASNKARDGSPLAQHGGFCLEAQHFPDSVNQPSFPSTILNPGQTYKQTTRYVFKVR